MSQRFVNHLSSTSISKSEFNDPKRNETIQMNQNCTSNLENQRFFEIIVEDWNFKIRFVQMPFIQLNGMGEWQLFDPFSPLEKLVQFLFDSVLVNYTINLSRYKIIMRKINKQSEIPLKLKMLHNCKLFRFVQLTIILCFCMLGRDAMHCKYKTNLILYEKKTLYFDLYRITGSWFNWR